MSEINYKTYRIKFEKTGVAKYISHLDLNRLFSRSLARAGIEVAHTEGFNPRPKIVFASAISLGIESFCEFVDMKINVGRDDPGAPQKNQTDININVGATLCGRPQTPVGVAATPFQKGAFPQGINIIEVYEPSNDFKNIDKTRFYIFVKPDGFNVDELTKLFEGDVFVEKKPGVNINLKDYIDSIVIDSDGEYIKINATVKSNQDKYLNPENIVKAINLKYNNKIDDYFIQKIEVYDKNNEVFR